MIRLLLLFGCLFGQAAAFTQGLLLDDAGYDALPRLPDYGSKSSDSLLRTTAKVDLRPYCPRPQHQGTIGSCTGWSTGYGAMSMLRAMERGWAGQTDSITRHALSALYLYNQVKIGSCQGGAYIHKAVQMAREEGSVLSSAFDRFKNDCDFQPTAADSLAARPNRIRDYATLFGSKAGRSEKLDKVRLSLLQHKPVVMGMLLRRNFQDCRAHPPYWNPALGDTTFMGAHAMVVVGYDDGRQAFELLNSWGTDWGNDGFIWVRYDDFARYCTYAIQLLPGAAAGPVEQPLSATLTADVPTYGTDDELRFRPENFVLRGEHYEPAGGAVAPGALLRWQLPRITPDSYLYAFSLDAGGKPTVHWPRDGTLDDKFAGKRESAVVTLANPDLYLPGEYGALRFGEPGTEYVCFLFTREPLDDLNAVLSRLRTDRNGSFRQRLGRALSQRLVPPERVGYNGNAPAFDAGVGQGEVVAVSVRVVVR